MRGYMRSGIFAVLCVSIGLSLHGCGGGFSWRPKTKLRIGTNHSPPFNYIDSSGRATGFGYDVLNQAAQRTNIELVWVNAAQGPEQSFADGIADLWPVVTYFEERKSAMHLTEPWWRLATVLYFREGASLKSEADLDGKRIIVTSPSRRFLPRLQLTPRTRLETTRDPAEGLRQVCTGESDAALIDLQVAEGTLLNRPEACAGVRFGSLYLEKAAREFSIGAKRGFEEEAERLRDAIDEVAADGEMIRLAAKWRFVDQTDPALFAWLESARQRSHRLNMFLLVLSAGLGLTSFALYVVQTARKKAELSAQTRARFLANMSHEIRTPMNGILGMTDLVLSSELNSQQREYLTFVRDAGRQLLHILNDILELSRAESGKLTIESIPADIRSIVENALLGVTLTAEEKGLQLIQEMDPRTPQWITGDPIRIQQILNNLLTNAVKFTATGSIRLRVSPETKDGESRLCFAVTDTGIGIEPSAQRRIFDAFTQADSSMTRRFGGTGLGLAISSHLARMMGGQLKVHSQPGVGSTFRFCLPLLPADPPPDRTEAPPPALAAAPVIGRPLRVLVAEDNRVNRILAERILTAAGHEVRTVEDGEMAVAEFLSRVDGDDGYDLILMDVHMPVMDGFEAVTRIRQSGPAGREIPIVALTALAVRGDADRCFRAGMNAYVSKPFRREDLLATLARFAPAGEPAGAGD
jgi:signal transduction histidine kinase/CheY-like chemotaxis protein